MLWTIMHDMFKDARSRIEEAIEAAEGGPRGAGITLDGPSGVGKTILLKHLEKTEPRRREESGAKIPRARLKMPASPTPKAMYAAILGTVGDMVPGRGRESELAERTIRQLKNVENKVLMIDDTQHVWDHCAAQDRIRLTDCLKNIIDETGTTLVLAGLPRIHDLISLNEQLFIRLSAPVSLRRFSWQDADDRGHFLDIVATAMNRSGELKWPRLDSEELGFRMYVATGGLIGYVVKVFEQAVRIARRRGSSTVTLEMLAEAYAMAVYRKAQGFSEPFDMNIDLEPDDIELQASIHKIGESAGAFG